MSLAEAGAAVWVGRLATGLDPRARALNDSLPVDQRLWPEELALSRAYAESLAECGVLTPDARDALLAACDVLEAELASGRTTLAGEDVHSAVESALQARCGDPALRLHTGRSRNDQVATLLRLRVMQLCDDAVAGVRALEHALVAQARDAGSLACAAHTHLQPAQPVRLAHFWLAHVAAFERDEARFASAREAADRMPLGSGAISGTPLVYDRVALAMRLGFSRVAANSLDAVGDRDFALEYLNAAALLGLHLSRLGEDLVVFASPAFGWFRSPDGFSTGSSLLPQKRNPDLFELARGKCARLLANAQRLATLLKGLPSGYQKDLQEDKEAVFDTADTLAMLLDALPPAVAALHVDPKRVAASLTPDLLAVELADALVERGVPFREAHRHVGQLWALAEQQGIEPAALPLEERLALHSHFTDALLASVDVESALRRRSHAPGSGDDNIQHQLQHAEQRLGIQPPHAAPAVREVPPGTPAKAPGARDGGATSRKSDEAARMAAEERSPEGLLARRARHVSEIDRGADAHLRPATVRDVPGIAAVMASYVQQGVLLPRPVSELYQCVREFHVAEVGDTVVATAALRLLWDDLGEVRSLAVRPDHHGRGLGAALVARIVDDARALGLPRVIALTREVAFFERCGFAVVPREQLPRKVWTDCVRCPKRHACDEVAVVLDLVPGASEAAAKVRRSWTMPIPQAAHVEPLLPVIS